MTNQDAVDIARRSKDPQKAAKQLTAEALKRDSKDDISCVVVKFRWWYLSIQVSYWGAVYSSNKGTSLWSMSTYGPDQTTYITWCLG